MDKYDGVFKIVYSDEIEKINTKNKVLKNEIEDLEKKL